MAKQLLVVGGLAILLSCGCTHTRLRLNTVQQAWTVSDIYQQQVLDNLALFVRDPNALPHFALATGGQNEVTDSGELSGGVDWDVAGFMKAALAGKGSRTAQQNWSLNPVSDPRRLERIRCAFQNAVAAYHQSSPCDCPECQKVLNKFYTGETNEPPRAPSDPKSDGQVTSACLTSGWFHVGCETCAKRMRKRNPCCKIGTNCGCAVWVTPGEGTDQLAKLTIAVLDYAINDPPPGPGKKEVTIYLDANRKPANPDNATFVVKASVTADSDVRVPLSPDDLARFNAGVQTSSKIHKLKTLQELRSAPTDDLQKSLIEEFENELRSSKEKPEPLPQGEIVPSILPQPQPSPLQTPADQLFRQQLQKVQ